MTGQECTCHDVLRVWSLAMKAAGALPCQAANPPTRDIDSMRESSRIIVAALLVTGMTACNRGSDGPPVREQAEIVSLAGSEWVLRAFGREGEEKAAVPPIITVAFGADSTFAGSAGCNRYFGRYLTPGGNSLTLGEAGATMMACPEPAMTQEYRYLQTLGNVERYQMMTGELLLLDETGQVLRFAMEPAN
jgi:heat shock protein HslJ